MKKILVSIALILFALCAYSQKDVTQFLGIPIDGSKSAMIQKLKSKGFRVSSVNQDALEGRFNGTDVNLFIVTNNDKVSRIVVCDANPVDERSIQIRFNNLCYQFEKNPRYIAIKSELIPDDEDISYEILVNKKRYEANFCQKPALMTDSALFQEKIMPKLLEKYTPEELANPSEEVQKELINMSTEYAEYMAHLGSKKSVWFMICDFYGRYYITMFYDNEYNFANGEDL